MLVQTAQPSSPAGQPGPGREAERLPRELARAAGSRWTPNSAARDAPVLYNILASKKTTGSGSRMDASSRPLASRGPLGITTCSRSRAGTCAVEAHRWCKTLKASKTRIATWVELLPRRWSKRCDRAAARPAPPAGTPASIQSPAACTPTACSWRRACLARWRPHARHPSSTPGPSALPRLHAGNVGEEGLWGLRVVVPAVPYRACMRAGQSMPLLEIRGGTHVTQPRSGPLALAPALVH